MLTGATITDEQIHALQARNEREWGDLEIAFLCAEALLQRHTGSCVSEDTWEQLREQARARCAEILNRDGTS